MSAEVRVLKLSPFPSSPASLLSHWDAIKGHPGAYIPLGFCHDGASFSSFLS
jgi:hypothetical protein